MNTTARLFRCAWAVLLAAAVQPLAAIGQSGDVLISVDVVTPRERMHGELQDAVRELEAKAGKDPSLYKPDGSLNRNHPAYKDYQKQAAQIKQRYDTNDGRFKTFEQECKKIGVGTSMKNSGGVPKSINSDCDFSEVEKGAGKKIMDHLRGKGVGVQELPDRWVIGKWDSTIWKMPTREVVGTSAHQAQEAMNAWSDDIFSTMGGKFRTSNGQVGIKDPVGEVLANAKKFSEAVNPRVRDPGTGAVRTGDLPHPAAPPEVAKVNGHIAGKSIAKMAEWSGAKVSPEFIEQAKALRAHRTWEEAGVVKYGDPPHVKEAKIREWLNKGQDYVGKAMEAARTQSAELASKRAKLAEICEKGGLRNEAIKHMENQIRVNVSNEETLKYLARTDPKLAAQASGMKVRVNPDGSFTNTATGQRMTPSQLEEAVVKVARETTAEAMKSGSQRTGPKSGGGLLQTIGKALIAIAVVDGAMQGAEKAVAEEKPGSWTHTKATIYGTIYATGIPAAWEQGSQAGKEAGEKFRQDLKEGKNPYLWGAIRMGESVVRGVGGFGKGMFFDPLVQGGIAVKEGVGAGREYVSATWAERQSKKSLKEILEEKERRARQKEGDETRQSRIILAENWVRMRGIPLITGVAPADNEHFKRTNPDEYNHRIALILSQYDALAAKLRRDGALAADKNLARKQIFNLLWHKRRGSAKEYQQALADHYKSFGKTYATVPAPQDLAGPWKGGEFCMKSTAFGQNSGCTPEIEQQFKKMENKPLPLALDLKPNADGTGVMTLKVTPPGDMDPKMGAQLKGQQFPAIPYRYENGKIVGELDQQGAKFKVAGEVVRTESGWALKGDWQISASNQGRTSALLKGSLSGSK